MDEFERKQFWDALERLYNETESLKAAIGGLHATVEVLKTAVGGFHNATDNLLRVVESQERRLDRVEVTNVAIQEDMRTMRESIQRIERKLDARDNN